MSGTDQWHLLECYIRVKDALDEMLKVQKKDKYLIQMQGALYRMEDMLYQYTTEKRKVQ